MMKWAPRRGVVVAALLAGFALVGCNRTPPAPKDFAEAKPVAVTSTPLSPPKTIRPNVQFRETVLTRGGVPMRVWYYAPANASGKLPLVVVPPAGSTLFVGMDLGDGDRNEHFPYVNAGFAVASFEIDGPMPQGQPNDAAIAKAARQFRDAQAGLGNARAALDYLFANIPEIDQDRVAIAGHSSAATLALLTAAHEPRIKACLAYAPATDVEADLAPALGDLNRMIPGFRDFIRFSSPKTHVAKLQCPTFLFHAEDDDNVPASQTKSFAADLQKTNPNVTLELVPRGGHYDSMVQQGVPKGIKWLKGVQAKGG